MAITMFRSGRRFFSAAAILMLVTAALHTFGFFAPHPLTPAESGIMSAMSNFREDMGSMHPSMADIYFSLAMAMTVTFFALGIISLVLASSNEISDAMIQRIGWINFLWVTAICIESYHYQIPPPLIFGIIIDIFVLAGLLLPSRKST